MTLWDKFIIGLYAVLTVSPFLWGGYLVITVRGDGLVGTLFIIAGVILWYPVMKWYELLID